MSMDNNREPLVKPRDIIEAINGVDVYEKTKTAFGIYFELVRKSDNSIIPKETIVIEKPIINVFSFSDESGEIYYKVEFLYKSFKDEDFKQQWTLLKAFCADASMVTEENIDTIEHLPMLTVSLLPKEYAGEYFALCSYTAGSPFLETIEKIENALNDSVSISMIFSEDEFRILSSDPDMIDNRSIEAEVEAEIDAELDVEVGPSERASEQG